MGREPGAPARRAVQPARARVPAAGPVERPGRLRGPGTLLRRGPLRSGGGVRRPGVGARRRGGRGSRRARAPRRLAPPPGGKAGIMTRIPYPPVPLSKVGRAAHDLGLAGLLGGKLFGRLALHPAVTQISDQRERGKLVNAAWRRYGTVNSLSLLAVASGW